MTAIAKRYLTRRRLLALLRYDRTTGEFFWMASGRQGLTGKRAGCYSLRGGRRYCVIKIDGVHYLAHRLAWFYVRGEWPRGKLDHRSGDGFDNRLRNLRPATDSQNNGNRRPQRAKMYSDLKGVSFYKHGARWTAGIKINGKQTYLGLFDTPEAAHGAYAKAARKVFGQYARMI